MFEKTYVLKKGIRSVKNKATKPRAAPQPSRMGALKMHIVTCIMVKVSLTNSLRIDPLIEALLRPAAG